MTLTDNDVQAAIMKAEVQVNRWISLERNGYARKKWEEFRTRDVNTLATEGLSEDGYWMGFIGNYIRRAQVLGLDNPLGRQALGKAIVTMHAALEAAIVVFGPLPSPGVPSGEL